MNPAHYFQQVDSAWYDLSQRILSPLDWSWVEAWFEAGIPLAAVLVGMEITFRNLRRKSPAAQVRSIAYCAAEVYDAWEEYALAQVHTNGVAEAGPQTETGSQNKL